MSDIEERTNTQIGRESECVKKESVEAIIRERLSGWLDPFRLERLIDEINSL